MDQQRHDPQQPTKKAENATQETHERKREAEARKKAENAARAVMHPEGYDREWRFYHGAWGG